ncbi:CarboxypepD_reg-like domain-containing protein [Gillisia sp. Hel1_33_143]|uniref:FEKKY domain-containing protein n=1 Tax=Gillisia sp. Hel1_33_143 TaxID=1336796 RepID=UPI00087B2687|nr:carboxypeptidase-like regulatory domain-containing protein [Gillisia sp. Hel1_33_143]SDS66428.1 CarboxypepD_reg-like domain-containing protein [Gillisia sp. Hel1_33_143]
MKTTILLLTLFISSFGFSQNDKSNTITIKGIIFSEVDGKPLENAYINYTSKYKYSMTNENGKFEYKYLNNKEDLKEKIEISALGYENYDTIIDLNKDNIIDLFVVLKTRFGLNRQKALEDIEQGEINILLSGGIAPVIYNGDKKFCKKYQVNFIEYGCEAISERSLIEYNKTVFEYLDAKFGKKWREEIRDDVSGL